jgi:hypothetical protein
MTLNAHGEICRDLEPDEEAHHNDYSKPLDITWLCRVHHGREHHPRPGVTR